MLKWVTLPDSSELRNHSNSCKNMILIEGWKTLKFIIGKIDKIGKGMIDLI